MIKGKSPSFKQEINSLFQVFQRFRHQFKIIDQIQWSPYDSVLQLAPFSTRL